MESRDPGDSITRRDACRLGGVGLLGLTLSPIRQRAVRAEEPTVGPTKSATAPALEDRWWPVQSLPRAIVRTRDLATLAQQMMVQSIAGLAAKAVNLGQGEELVWVSSANVEPWLQTFLKQHPAIEDRGPLGPWELVERFAARGVIKGYILYAQDKSEGRTNDHRPDMDLSVNVATSLAGLLDGVIIDESLEAEARAHGLTLLLDVRDKTQAWCFETYQDKFNRRLLGNQDPRKSHVRDLAVAHQALVLYGPDEPLESAMKWLEPLSPILGWNGGDEFETTRLSSIYGHLQTASDWCVNLPVLMAASERTPAFIAKVPAPFDPRSIDWSDRRPSVSFILSDGDNVQWLEGNFFHKPSFWAHPDRGQIPFGWSTCFAQLAQLCPAAIDYALATQAPNDQFLEWGAGYYYPDLFGQARPNGRELLAAHARRSWKFMKETGTRIIAFNAAQADSPAALAAYATIAGETDDLSAILVFQYAPYEAGAGQTFWVRDRRGVEIPVITARYSIWEHSNHRPRSGTPAKVAREILARAADQPPRHDWAIVHAWSYFRAAPGADEEAENMPQDDAPAHGGVRGYNSALFCAQRLPADVRVVTPEEMVWRQRMAHDPAATKQLLAQLPTDSR